LISFQKSQPEIEPNQEFPEELTEEEKEEQERAARSIQVQNPLSNSFD